MKAVLISIQPKWCELIASGKKTIEVRKTRPKIEAPFKVYIYCTQASPYNPVLPMKYEKKGGNIYIGGKKYAEFLTSRVIGEFTCDGITEYEGEFYDDETQESIKKIIHTTDWDGCPDVDYSFIAENGEENGLCKSSCLDWEELRNYMGAGINTFFGWHISDLKIYDKPKELREFVKYRADWGFRAVIGALTGLDCNEYITRPPQSWMYVEEKERWNENRS